jgi:hypothetical protein
MYGESPSDCTFDFKKRVDRLYDIAIQMQRSCDAIMRSSAIAAKGFPTICDVPLIPDRIGDVSRFYSQLLQSYKNRLDFPAGKLANEEKIAALTALAVLWVGPFQAADKTDTNGANLARNKNFLLAINIIFFFLAVPSEECERHQGALRAALDSVTHDEQNLPEPLASSVDLLVFACRVLFHGRLKSPPPTFKYAD